MLIEGSCYAFFSMLAFDRLPPSRRLIFSWAFFLTYLIATCIAYYYPKLKTPLRVLGLPCEILAWLIVFGETFGAAVRAQ
jgi:hypothetical protein